MCRALQSKLPHVAALADAVDMSKPSGMNSDSSSSCSSSSSSSSDSSDDSECSDSESDCTNNPTKKRYVCG